MTEKNAFKSVKVAKFESDSLKGNDYWGALQSHGTMQTFTWLEASSCSQHTNVCKISLDFVE